MNLSRCWVESPKQILLPVGYLFDFQDLCSRCEGRVSPRSALCNSLDRRALPFTRKQILLRIQHGYPLKLNLFSVGEWAKNSFPRKPIRLRC